MKVLRLQRLPIQRHQFKSQLMTIYRFKTLNTLLVDEDPHQLTLLIQNLTTNSLDLNLLLASIAMLSLLFCSAMISGSEVAYFSLDASK